MKNKIYIGVTLLLLVMIFTVQNAAIVDIQLLFWKMSMPRSLMIFFVLSIGIFVGWIITEHFHRKRE